MTAHQAVHHVATGCRVLGVSPSGYYAWRKRPLSPHARADVELSAHIDASHRASRGTYGAPRVHAELAALGIHIGRKRVARLMRALGVHAGHAVGAAGARMNRLDLRAQGDIGPGARRERPLPPRIVPAGRDPQDPAQRGEAMSGPVRRHELESLDGIEPVSRANQAAALLRNSPWFFPRAQAAGSRITR